MAEKDWIAEAAKALEGVNKKMATDNKKNLKEVSDTIKVAANEASAEKDPDKKEDAKSRTGTDWQGEDADDELSKH